MARKPSSPSAYSFERLLARVSNELVAAPLASLDDAIVGAQNAIVHFLDLDRSTLFLFDETSAARRFHLAARPGYEQVDIGPPHLEFPWVASQILAGKMVRFTRIDDLPPEAAVDRATFHRVGPRSNVTFPLIAGGQVFGALAFGMLREERRWLPSVVRRLGLLAETIANTIYRRRADEALRGSEARTQLALDSAEVGLWSWDVGADTYWGSDLVRRLYGEPEEGALRVDALFAKVHELDRVPLREALDACMGEARELRIEFRLVLADGQVRWISSRGRLVAVGFGDTRRLVGVSYDVTARARAEQSERRMRAELAHVARLATLSELSASLAHELNQPLAALLSNAQAGLRLLDFDPPDLDETRVMLGDMVADVKRANEVVRRVRHLVRKGEPEISAVDLAEVVSDALRLLKKDALLRRVRVETKLMPVPPVRADRIQLQQVVMNLLINAFESFSLDVGPEPRKVDIALTSADGVVRLEVSDTGAGISAYVLTRLFQPFHTTKPQGLGIGLSLCRTIVEAHGGSIEVAPRDGGGTCFFVTFPLLIGPSSVS